MLSADGLCHKYGGTLFKPTQFHISNPTWDLSFITFNSAGQLVCVHKETIDHPSSYYYPYKTALLSCLSSCSNNICSSHTLIFQVGGNIGIYQLEAIGSSYIALDFHPTCSFELKRDDDEQLDHFAIGGFFRWKTSWNTSACQHTTYPPHLGHDVIWLHESWLDEDEFELSSKTKSELSDPVLGHTYSIIALQSPLNNIAHSRDSAINIVVISTHTGETVWEYTKQIRNVSSYTIGKNTALIGVPQREVECLAVVKKQWLSDIHTVSSPTEPFMIFTNFAEIRYGRRTIDDLCFNP